MPWARWNRFSANQVGVGNRVRFEDEPQDGQFPHAYEAVVNSIANERLHVTIKIVFALGGGEIAAAPEKNAAVWIDAAHISGVA